MFLRVGLVRCHNGQVELCRMWIQEQPRDSVGDVARLAAMTRFFGFHYGLAFMLDRRSILPTILSELHLGSVGFIGNILVLPKFNTRRVAMSGVIFISRMRLSCIYV